MEHAPQLDNYSFADMPEQARRRVLDLLAADCTPDALRTLRTLTEGRDILRWLLTTDESSCTIDA